jgi:hypothetical protein
MNKFEVKGERSGEKYVEDGRSNRKMANTA